MCLLTTLFCVPFHCSLVRTCRRPSSAFAVDFDGPALPRGVDTSGNIFDMLGRLNLSSLHSNIQHLATTISGHSPSLVADALCNQPAHVSYNQHEPSLSVSIGSNRSSMSRAVQLRGQTYLSRGWAASHLQLNDGRTQHAASSDTNLPLLDRVSEQCSAHCVMFCLHQAEHFSSQEHLCQQTVFRQPVHHTSPHFATKAFIKHHYTNIYSLV